MSWDAARRGRERGYRRVLGIGLALSVLLHVGVLWSVRSIQVRATPYALPPVETSPAPEGLVVVDVAPTPVDAPDDEPRPEPNPPDEPVTGRVELEVVEITPVDPEVVGAPGAPVVAGPERTRDEEAEGEGLSNAERLTPRFVDARIWFDPTDPTLFGERLARFARADSAVRAILRDWLDSLSLSDEERRRALDWTIERDGKKWGISPGKLHLGDITIPLPFGFAPNGPQRREFEQAIRDLREIQLQNLRQDAEEVGRERREAMRERSEEEARRRSGDTLRVGRRPDPAGAFGRVSPAARSR